VELFAEKKPKCVDSYQTNEDMKDENRSARRILRQEEQGRQPKPQKRKWREMDKHMTRIKLQYHQGARTLESGSSHIACLLNQCINTHSCTDFKKELFFKYFLILNSSARLIIRDRLFYVYFRRVFLLTIQSLGSITCDELLEDQQPR
jgi:hypothetical protein